MYNFKEGGGCRPYHDFIGPVVDPPITEPLAGFVEDRRPDDYTEGRKYLLPPNVLRTLASKPALTNLSNGMEQVRHRSSRFGKFDIHLRGLYDGCTEKLLMPWDLLTYVEFDGHICYGPVNVSFSHQVMNCKWDDDPQEDFRIKRDIVEQQIADITTCPGIMRGGISVYGVSFPENFSHGTTNRILTGYPSYFQGKSHDDLKGVKRVYDLGTEIGNYAYYFFRGIAAEKRQFRKIIDDPDFVDYNKELSRRWNRNFNTLINEGPNLDPMNLYPSTRYRLLKCLGADPEPPEEDVDNNLDCE